MQEPTKEIRGVVAALLSGTAKQRQEVIDKVFTPDAKFIHPLLVLQGRRDIYNLYEYWSTVNLRITFELPKIVLSQNKDRLVLDFNQYVTPHIFPWVSPIIRLVVFLDLQRTPQGYKISCQEDHLLWADSLVRNVPFMDLLWNEYGRQLVRLGIMTTMQGVQKSFRFLSRNVFPRIPYLDKSTAFQTMLRAASEAFDNKLLRKWEAERSQQYLEQQQ